MMVFLNDDPNFQSSFIKPFNLNFLNLQIKKLHDSSNKYVVFFNINFNLKMH